jgi:protein-tyrosine phosphatase
MTPDIYRIKGIEPLQLAVMPRPRGGDSLANEIQGLFRSGISTIVSMLEQQEARELELGNEEALCHDYGISFISFPVRDRGVPLTFQSLDALVAVIIEQLKAKRQVAIHCRAGIGRSGLLAGCVLTSLGRLCG